ncbi:MAG: peptidylprolyl isomerase [Planctomycetaceae bacterium]
MLVAPRIDVPGSAAWCCCLLVVAGWAVAQPSRADDAAAPPAAAAVARVGDTPVLQSAVDAVIRRLGPQQTITSDRRRYIEATVLEQLVDELLISSELEHRQISVADSEIEKALGQFKAQFKGDESYQAFLAATGRDEAGLRDQLRVNMGMEKYARPLMTPAKFEAVFQEKRREVDGTRLRVSHILLRPDILDVSGGGDGIDRIVAKAEAIRRDVLQNRTSFEDAARLHSAAPSRHRGGDIGWIGRDGPMVEEFARPVYRLAKGDVSRPIVTPFGVHIVKVTDVQPGRIGIDVVRPRIEKVLLTDLVRVLVDEARARLPVTYSPGVAHFDPATPADAAGPRRIIVAGSESPAK